MATNFHIAPSPKNVDGMLAVPIDIQLIHAAFIFDGATKTASADGILTYIVGPTSGNPIFDLRQEIREAWLDDESFPVEKLSHHPFGSEQFTDLRVIEADQAAGSVHTLRVRYNLALPDSQMGGSYLPAIDWSDGPTLRFVFGLSDLNRARYVEAWLPANLIFDQFGIHLEIRIVGTTVAHSVITNGSVTSVGANHWIIDFPDRFTALSPMLEVRASDSLIQQIDSVALPVSGKTVKIEAWKPLSSADDLTVQIEKIKSLLVENEKAFGSYIHGERFVVFFNEGGMEYDGGAVVSFDTILYAHETFHSWFGRGIKPASQADGWWDEGFACFYDDGADDPIPFDFSDPPTVLCSRDPWQRNTPSVSYEAGTKFWKGMADLLGVANLKSLMSDFYNAYRGQPVSSQMIEEFLLCRSGNAGVVDAFHRFVYGLPDPSPVPDLWIRDDQADVGTDSWEGEYRDSPDLWIRNEDDGGLEHQPLEYGQDNWIYALIRNKPDTGESKHFAVAFNSRTFAGSEYVYPDEFLPCLAAKTEFDLPSGEIRIVKARWSRELVPYPGTNLCLLASVITNSDHPAKGSRVWEHNNLARKDITVVDLLPDEFAAKDCFLIVDRSTFGEDEIGARLQSSNPAVIEAAFYFVVDGFSPHELGITEDTPADHPDIKPDVAISPTLSEMLVTPVHLAMDDRTQLMVQQRLTWTYQVEFNAKVVLENEIEPITLTASISTVSASAFVYLIKQSNPYEIDGPISWLSTDLRVFQIRPGEKRFNAKMGDTGDTFTDAATFISEVITNLNENKTDGETFEDDLSIDLESSVLELSEKVNKVPIFNFAVACVRYRSMIQDAVDVSVFFRIFLAPTTSLEYDPSTTYRAGGKAGVKIPLLGIRGNQVASIPCFAEPRIDTATVSMNDQKDPKNMQTIAKNSAGIEVVKYFGCWLDINQRVPRFPLSLLPNDDGPFSEDEMKTIQQHIRGKHSCLVAEIAFGPDSIPTAATPGSSDKLAQRNLTIIESDNPGGPTSHRIPQTFEIRPTRSNLKTGEAADELMIDWGNTPVGSSATLYLPGVSVSSILEMASRKYGPHRLVLIGDHAFHIPTGGMTYIPIPQGIDTGFVGLLSVDLPGSAKKGQVFTIVVRQVTSALAALPVKGNRTPGLSREMTVNVMPPTKSRRILGTFQITIPVRTKDAILEKEERLLSNLLWIHRAIPEDDRWFLVFGRYIEQTAGRVDAFGGDSSRVNPSPSGEWQDTAINCRQAWLLIGAVLLAALIIVILDHSLQRVWVLVAILSLLIVAVAIAAFCRCFNPDDH